MTRMLLVQPPVLIPSEPPLSLAVLYSSLQTAGIDAHVLDANLGAYLYLLDEKRLSGLAGDKPKTSIHRALKHCQESLDLLRSAEGSTSFSRYSTAVRYLNLLLSLWSKDNQGERLTLGDYQYKSYSVFNPDHLRLFSSGQVRTLFHPYFETDFLPRIATDQPQQVAISINYLHQVFPAFELAGLLRRNYPDIKLIAGGGLLTSWQEPLRQHNLNLPPFDHLVFGPGEASLIALAAGQAQTKQYHADTSMLNFLPDFSFAEQQRYLSPQPVLPVSASRGCYWRRCLFCPEAATPVHPYGSYPPRDFPDLLLQLSEQYAVTNFHLTDNAIPINILKHMAERRTDLHHLSWFGFVRFETVLEDPDFVRQLAAAGCQMLQLGLESGSQRVLDSLGKGLKLESAVRILDNLNEAGIISYVYIMLGTPGETEADAEMTLNYLEQHAEKIGFLNISIMNLPRGSELLENPELYGISSSQLRDEKSPLGLYHEFHTTSGLDRATARNFLNQRLLGSPIIREIVHRNPPFFSSNHAFFFPQKSAQ